MNPLPNLYGTIWAITPAYYRAISHAMATRSLDIEGILRRAEERRAAAAKPATRKPQAIAVVPIVGPIEYRQSVLGAECGWPSSEAIADQVEELVADPSVKAVLMDMDTPGGVAAGIPESANRIYRARGKKPIIAVANTMSASAGYWFGTAADKFYITPSGEAGSIGVFSEHTDVSAAMEREGVKKTIFKAGKFKAEFNPYEPLTEEARDHEQEVVDEIYGEFLSAVATHRGVSVAKVRSDFGEGRTVSARKAVAVGMADGVATLQQVIGRIQSGKLSMSTLSQQVTDWDDGPVLADDTSERDSETRRRRMAMRTREVV